VRLRAPDCLPHQVKSADAKTTLLHYLATLLTTTLIDELKGELNSLPDAKEISLSDKKSELAKLVASVEQAQQQLDLGKKEGDPMTPLLAEFLETSTKRLDELKKECADAEGAMKQLAQWLAEKPTATTEELFRPLDEFVKALDKALQDNVREAEAEKRKAAAAEGAGQGWRKAAASATAAGKPPNMGMALPGMGGPGADKAMQVCGAAAEGPA